MVQFSKETQKKEIIKIDKKRRTLEKNYENDKKNKNEKFVSD